MYSKSILKACDLLIKLETGKQKKAYTTDPNGKVNVPKLLGREDAFWEKQASQETFVKPVIVFTDWSYKYQEVSSAKLEWIYALMDEEVELYAWTGELFEIHSAYDLEKALKNIQPIHPSELEKIVSQKDIEKDRLKIIDYFERRRIESIFFNEEENLTILYFSNLEQELSTAIQESIIQSLSSYLFFEIGVELTSIKNFDLLVKCAALPQSKGIVSYTNNSAVKKNDKFIEVNNLILNYLSSLSADNVSIDLLNEMIKRNELKNLKRIGISNNYYGSNNSIDLTTRSNQLQSLILQNIYVPSESICSFNLLQQLILISCDVRVFYEIGLTAPDIDTLYLEKNRDDHISENINKLDLLKLKKLTLCRLQFKCISKIFNLPSRLEVLLIEEVDFDEKDKDELEKPTQLKTLAIKKSRMPADCFITMLKNNRFLEEIYLLDVQFFTCQQQVIELTKLIETHSHLLLSLRSIVVKQEKTIDIHAVSLALIKHVNHIEQIEIQQNEPYGFKNKVIYHKNQQILINGPMFEASLFSLFFKHSNHVKSISIKCELITAALINDNFLLHKDKLTHLKSLDLSEPFVEEYLAQYPSLKRMNFNNISLKHGSLEIKKEMDFQLLLKLIQHTNLDITRWSSEIDVDILNEKLVLEYSGNFPFKSLIIGNNKLLPRVIAKLINASPYLESLQLSSSLEMQVVETIFLSNSIEVLILNQQSTQSICNILKHKPVLKHLELVIPEKNEQLFTLLEQCIVASTQLTTLIIEGEVSSKFCQRILDFIIEKQYDMQALILGNYFVFKKNKELIVKIPTKEEYLLDLLKASPGLKKLEINQPMPIRKMLEGRIWDINNVSLVSCLHSPSNSKSLSETFDFLLSVCPDIKGTRNASINFYTQNSFFIIKTICSKGAIYSKLTNKLHTTERLSNAQFTSYHKQFSFDEIDIQGIDGLLVDKQRADSIYNFKDSFSLLDNLDMLMPGGLAGYVVSSLNSPFLKIIRQKLEWHGDKFSEEQILKILDLKRKMFSSTLTIHNKLSLAVVNAVEKESTDWNGSINLISMNDQEELISRLIKIDNIKLNARNADQQILYQIEKDKNDIGCEGVRFPPSLLFLLLNKQDCFKHVRLKNLSFDAPFKLPGKITTYVNQLSLDNVNIRIDCLEHWLANHVSLLDLNIINCINITSNQLQELKNKYPKITIRFEGDLISSQTYALTDNTFEPSKSLPELKIINYIDITSEPSKSLPDLDSNTGEQSQHHDFRNNSQPMFRAKKSQRLYPNYLRLQVYYEGSNQIKILEDIPFRRDLTQHYEDHWADKPDYYLAGLRLSLKKNEWHDLPSITPEDKLIAFHASGKFELGYSEKQNLFKIRCAKSCNIDIAFILHSVLDIRFSDEPVDNKYQAYFPCIQSINLETHTIDNLFINQFLSLQKMPLKFREELLISFCRFDVGDLSNPSLQGKKLLNLLIRERKGVCRHNVEVFKELKMFFNKHKHKIKARVVESQTHVFIEMEHDNKWQMICLGGAAMPKPVDTDEDSFESQDSFDAEEIPLLIVDQDFSDLTEVLLEEQVELHHDVVIEPIVSTVQPEMVLPKIRDFSYVLSLNPFKSSNQPKNIPASDASQLVERLIDLAKELKPGEKNLLLNFESSAQIEFFYAAMASALSSNQKRFLLMHQPNEFNATEFIIDEKTGEHSSQATRLVSSVVQATMGDFLIVNLCDYNEKTVSRLNALTDRKKRVLANQSVSEALSIVAVKLHKTSVGEDVYSRFLNQEYVVPKLAEQNFLASFCKPLNPSISDEDVVVVDFYDGVAWKSQLIGSLELDSQQVRYQKGALIKMIESGRSSIRFYNSPMALDEFRVSLLHLVKTKQFDANGEMYYLPDDFSFESVTKNYDLACSEYSYLLNQSAFQKESSHVLNTTTYYHFFNNFQCKEERLAQKDGWLSQYRHQELQVWVTACLHESLWARLLDTAKQHQCQLVLSFESDLFKPLSMSKRENLEESNSVQPLVAAHKNHLILSNDAYYAEIQCQLKDKTPTVVFEVNENTRFSDLFEFIQLRKQDKDLAVDWHSCSVRDNLLKGHRVILKGPIDRELADKLNALFSAQAYVFVNGEKETYEGQLILISDENKFFKRAEVVHQKYHLDDFFTHLSQYYSETSLNSWNGLFQAFLQKAHHAGTTLDFNYLTIKSMLDLHLTYPQSNPFLPFILLHPKYKELKNIALSVYPEEEILTITADAFDAHRKQRVSQMLDMFSSGFLVGASGVGKSTFMKSAFAGMDVLFGLDNLEKWAKEGGLFYLDEVNLYPKGTLDFFAGLFNSLPGLLLNNQFYSIKLGEENGLGSKKHQLLFGGNYSHFANRQSHAFLQQVPVVEFEDFPDWYLKERVLTKMIQIACFSDAYCLNSLMMPMLNVYHHVNEHNPKAGWTVRNLENMAMRFILFREERPRESIETSAWLAAYDEVSNHNKDQFIGVFQKWIEEQYPLQSVITSLNERMNYKNASFTVTECRRNVFRLMQDQVKIQKLKSKYPELRNFGAVCGCLLEGESGIGKSKFAIELAESLGYKNGDELTQNNSANSQYYYFLSQDNERFASMDSTADDLVSERSLSPSEQRLTELFHQGAVVIIDELNSVNLEKILNSLMSGVDLSMRQAQKPGFFVFAAQNPIYYQGRKNLAIPLENRMFKLEFLDYSQKGLFQIAKHSGLHPLLATAYAAFFHQISLNRTQNTTFRAPNFRHYLDKIESHQDNPLNEWFFLEKVYGYLKYRDRQALYCTSLFCLSAFAFLEQPALMNNPVVEKKASLSKSKHVTLTLDSDEFTWESEESSSEESTFEESMSEGSMFEEFISEGSSSEESTFEEFISEGSSSEESTFEESISEASVAEDSIPPELIDQEHNCCFSGIGMQVLGGFIVALGITAVAVAFVALNAATLGLAGVILAACGSVAVLVGAGFFAKGLVDSGSRAEEGICVDDPVNNFV